MAKLTDRARNDLNVSKGRKTEIKPKPNPKKTNRFDMTIVVDWDVKPQHKQTNSNLKADISDRQRLPLMLTVAVKRNLRIHSFCEITVFFFSLSLNLTIFLMIC